ncbi:hypothetical protein L484_019571 [Morus notabilis]|uniref:Uncharacterized protein n=1 Tax=Morus notabilis TaxID=981085 RepID=W9SKA9_9ROSA|nr:hypothetical protein L484_019571 [Morus notabilis]
MQLGKDLVTTSDVDHAMLMLDETAKSVGITILGEMGFRPWDSWYPAGVYEEGNFPPSIHALESSNYAKTRPE